MHRSAHLWLALQLLCSVGCPVLWAEREARAADEPNADAGDEANQNWQNRQKKTGEEGDKALQLKEIVEPKADYNYASFGRPDPFVQPELGGGSSKGPIDGKVIQMTSPLQGFAIGELTVKGVWQSSNGEVRAVVQTPKGEGVVVKNGDPISSGKVLTVAKDKLKVRLFRLRADGVREFEDVTMPVGINVRPKRGEIRLEPGKAPTFINPEDPYKKSSWPAPQAPATANLQGITGQPGVPPPMPPLGMPPVQLPPNSQLPPGAARLDGEAAPALGMPGGLPPGMDPRLNGQKLEAPK